MFTTYVDGQTGVDIHILQGERELVKDNRSLARFRLKIPPLPAGVPRIEVTFLIDANGILNVSARDVRTGETQSIAVKPSYGLTDEEVERMIGESFKFAAEDLKARQLIEATSEAEAILRAAEKALKQGGQLIAEEERSAIRTSMAALESAKSGTDHKAIRASMTELEQATHHLAEVLMDSSLKEALENKKLSEIT
jgi:molecular chaperone DnaK (HSP70)